MLRNSEAQFREKLRLRQSDGFLIKDALTSCFNIRASKCDRIPLPAVLLVCWFQGIVSESRPGYERFSLPLQTVVNL